MLICHLTPKILHAIFAFDSLHYLQSVFLPFCLVQGGIPADYPRRERLDSLAGLAVSVRCWFLTHVQ